MSVNIGESGEPIWKHFTRDSLPVLVENVKTRSTMILIDKLDKARGISGVAYKINSGYRCESHNAKVGGSPKSRA